MQAEKFVLQCRSCRNIIGDSSSLVRKSNDYHTLSRTSNVQLTTHIGKRYLESIPLITFSNPLSHLAEGTAQTFICNGCRSCLGAVYRATPPGFDYLRNNWTIDPNKIFKFTLGDTRLTLVVLFGSAHSLSAKIRCGCL